MISNHYRKFFKNQPRNSTVIINYKLDFYGLFIFLLKLTKIKLLAQLDRDEQQDTFLFESLECKNPLFSGLV